MTCLHRYYIKFCTILISTNEKFNACNIIYHYIVTRIYRLDVVRTWMWLCGQTKLLDQLQTCNVTDAFTVNDDTATSITHNKVSLEQMVALICNTRFIKGHKPSNHIRARIKSHVYTIEWTIYHSTYHVKRYNKASTNVIYYINDINVWYRVCESVIHKR